MLLSLFSPMLREEERLKYNWGYSRTTWVDGLWYVSIVVIVYLGWLVSAGCCVIISWYLPRGAMRRPEVISEDFQKLALRRAVRMREQWWLVGNWHWLCWVRGYAWLDSTLAALAGSKDIDPTFDTLLAGEEQIPLSLSTKSCHTPNFFSCCQLCLYGGNLCFLTGLSEGASVHRKFLY